MTPLEPDLPLIPWKVFAPDGAFAGLVFARNAIEATIEAPPLHSVYVGGPSAQQPERPWWTEAWKTGIVDPDDLLANDPRPGTGPPS